LDRSAEEGTTVGWIDVAIPGGIGLLMILAPGLFARSTGDATKDANKATNVRGGGALLLVVAAIYLFIKCASAK
jgi:hypothetical protein